MNFRLWASAAAFALIASPGLAQEVMGRTLIDGKLIEILDDKSWRIADSDSSDKDENCKTIHTAVTFCADPKLWKPSLPPTPEIAAAYRYDARHYGQFVIEGVGLKDGITPEFIRMAIIQNAAAATGQSSKDIMTIAVESATIDGNEAETVIYRLSWNGTNAVFANTILIKDSITIQAITYAIANEYTEQHKGLNKLFLENIRLN